MLGKNGDVNCFNFVRPIRMENGRVPISRRYEQPAGYYFTGSQMAQEFSHSAAMMRLSRIFSSLEKSAYRKLM
jgi:hypothetical protein